MANLHVGVILYVKFYTLVFYIYYLDFSFCYLIKVLWSYYMCVYVMSMCAYAFIYKLFSKNDICTWMSTCGVCLTCQCWELRQGSWMVERWKAKDRLPKFSFQLHRLLALWLCETYNFLVPQFSYLWKGNNNNTKLIDLSWELNWVNIRKVFRIVPSKI